MKHITKILLASAAFGLTLTAAHAQTSITVGSTALLAGFDFDNNLTNNIQSSIQRARYSDVFGNNSSNTALTAPGGIYFTGAFGSDNWGTVAKNAVGDINRDILTRSGSGSTFDLGGQSGGEGAANLNNTLVGTDAMNEFSILVHSKDAVNSFNDIRLQMYGRDVANAGGATINWSYSIDGGVTKVSTGLSSVFTSNAFELSDVDFSSIIGMNGALDLAIIGTVVESTSAVVLNFDNVGVYGVAAIPEPATYAAILGLVSMGIVGLRRRKSAQIA